MPFSSTAPRMATKFGATAGPGGSRMQSGSAATTASSLGRATRLDSLAAGSAGLADARPFVTGRCATRGTGFLVLLAVLAVRVSGDLCSVEGVTFFFGRSAKRTAGCAGDSTPYLLSPVEARDIIAAAPGATGARSCATANDDSHTVVAASKANTREIWSRFAVMAPRIGQSYPRAAQTLAPSLAAAPLPRKSSPRIAGMSATADGATVNSQAPREFCYMARSGKDEPDPRRRALPVAGIHEGPRVRAGWFGDVRQRNVSGCADRKGLTRPPGCYVGLAFAECRFTPLRAVPRTAESARQSPPLCLPAGSGPRRGS